MKQLLIFFVCCVSAFSSFGQDSIPVTEPKKVLDSLYREDQFYVGLTFNLLVNRSTGIDQSGFSGGLHLGFIRDMPINKLRNVAIGLGVGYSFNTYGQNLSINVDDTNGNGVFEALDGSDFDTNRFTTHLAEVPLEFRWRTSVPETHKFYRIYAGLRFGYLFHFRSNFEKGDIKVRETKVDELNRLRYGATFTFGWNTYNFSVYYSLNPLFNDDAKIDGERVGLNPIKIGLTFYIL
ncbi:porin family protein [Aquimarina sp. MMG016]|uniref:porin family protein n=1 Tax=Aquimarina sp. MMG016 TaxID=2822690 RepID=UPI001B3A19DB|nr:porin family protein [Aquimarina sp. MMG016]MBQ4818761.1 PorT family protein [Aquimarina sp. MMG016]